MTRYEFLKSAGFSGAALMALLTSCVREDDKYINALTVAPDGSAIGTTAGSTTGSTVETATGNIGGNTSAISGIITTEELNKIPSTKANIDLTSANYAKLMTVGGYLIVSNIIIALSKANTYIAATVTCSHEPKKQMIFYNNEWYCTAHGARFSLTGVGLNGNGRAGLKVYKVATDGKTLVVY